MFDIGFWELALIFIVALVVLGPERLPSAIRSVSQFVRTAKSMVNNVKDELSQELKIQELQENLRKAEQKGLKDLSPELQESLDQLKKAAQDVQKPYAQDKKLETSDHDEPSENQAVLPNDEASSTGVESLNIQQPDSQDKHSNHTH